MSDDEISDTSCKSRVEVINLIDLEVISDVVRNSMVNFVETTGIGSIKHLEIEIHEVRGPSRG